MKAAAIRWGAVGALAAVLVATSVMIAANPYTTVTGDPATAWLAAIAPAGLLVAAALHLERRRATLLAVAGIVWTAGESAGWSGGPAASRAAAVGLAYAAPLAAILTDARVARRPLVLAAGAVAIGGLAAATFVHDPFGQVDCWRTCLANPLAVGATGAPDGLVRALDATLRVGALAVVAAGVVMLRTAVVAGVRGGTGRRGVRAVQTVGAVALLVAAGARVFDDGTTRAVWLVGGAIGGSLIGAAAAAQFVVRRRTRAALARLIDELAGAPAEGALEASLSRSLGDPGLRVAYWSPERGAYVAPDGSPFDDITAAGRAATPVHRGVEPVAVIVHRASIDPADIEHAFRPAVRLWLDNARLRTMTRAELADLQASESRLAARAAEERRRIERDLHDGAQQRVVGLALLLRLARGKLGTGPTAAVTAVDRARDLLDDLLATLRRIARGA